MVFAKVGRTWYAGSISARHPSRGGRFVYDVHTYAERMLESIGPVPKRELSLGGSEPAGPPLLHACLKFNPSKRVTAAQALEDPFVGEFHKSEEEPDFPGGPVKIAVDDNTKLSAQDYRNNLYMQIQQIKREAKARAAKAAAPAPAAAGAVQQEGAAPAP